MVEQRLLLPADAATLFVYDAGHAISNGCDCRGQFAGIVAN